VIQESFKTTAMAADIARRHSVPQSRNGDHRKVPASPSEEDPMTRSRLFRELASRALLIGAPLWCLPVVHAQKADRASSSAEGRRCSNSTLNGAYAFAIEGVFVDAPSPLPLRGVALTRFDGLGHVTQVDHVVFNGGPPPVDWTPATGWYRINADCTGEMELDIPGSPFTPVILRLSVGANGTHINTVVSKPGYVVSSTGTKVDQDKDDRD
jgi:hypothetical protein